MIKTGEYKCQKCGNIIEWQQVITEYHKLGHSGLPKVDKIYIDKEKLSLNGTLYCKKCGIEILTLEENFITK